MTKKQKLINKAKVVEKHGLKCDDCGKRSPEVKHTTCPFAADVHNTVVECDLCPACEHERAMDI